MSKYVGFRLTDEGIISWLESRRHISDTAREALIRMKQGEELSAELVGKIDTLLTATERINKDDKKTHSLLQQILKEISVRTQ